MDTTLFKRLQAAGLISSTSLEKVKILADNKLFSIHWEIRTILYLGVLLLSGALGVLVYKNIDTIGHQIILLCIGLICAGCFTYCFKKKLPFSVNKVAAPNSFFDYLLLLGCLMFITFIGYLQFQYTAFGTAYGLATFIPLVVLFFSAYYFDHLGVLTMAITNLAAWMGIAVTPRGILQENDFNSHTIIYTALLLGGMLVAAGILSRIKNIKKHFDFTYTNYGAHVLFIACLAGLFQFEHIYLIWFLLLAAIAAYFYQYAMREHSFYFLLILMIYSYIGLSYVVTRLLFSRNNFDEGAIYLLFFYYIGSAIGVIKLLINYNKKLKRDAGI
jgi:hypothetical protein